jgi:hypothetical protein
MIPATANEQEPDDRLTGAGLVFLAISIVIGMGIGGGKHLLARRRVSHAHSAGPHLFHRQRASRRDAIGPVAQADWLIG